MHKRMSARYRAQGCVIAAAAMLAALALPVTGASASWAADGDVPAESTSVGGVSPADVPAADDETLAPVVEAVPGDDVAEQEPQTSTGHAPADDVAGQAAQPSAEESPADEAPGRAARPGATVDARQAEPGPVAAVAPSPEAGAAPAESTDSAPPIPAFANPSDSAAARTAEPASVPTPALTCLSSAFYAVSGDGVVQQVVDGPGTNDASFLPVGSWSVDSPAVDGLAVAAGGAAMYAVDVTPTGVENVLAYTAAAGWEVIPSSFEHRNTEPLVAGAVNLANGRYYVGGYHVVDPASVLFRLYSVDVESGQLALVGQLSTGLRSRDISSGDMAFDAAGNLYVLHGSHDGGVVFTVAASDVADRGPGGELAATASARLNLNGLNEGNGMAFSSRGTTYIGDPHHMRQFIPGTWSTPDNLVTVLHGSTDLASCNSPAAQPPLFGGTDGPVVETPGLPGEPPLVGGTDGPVVETPGLPGEPPLVGKTDGPAVETPRQRAEAPGPIEEGRPVIEAPRPVVGNVPAPTAERDDVGAATLPITGGGMETGLITGAGFLLGLSGLLLSRRRRPLARV